jgi:hypothetical protein
MRAARGILGALGVLVGLFGAWLLLSRQDTDQLVGAATWLAGGVVLHDFVLTPIVLAVAWLGSRLLPRPMSAPAVVGLVVLGSVTLLALPVLGRFGERPDNATLLDRDYTVGWLVVAGLTLVGVAIGTWVVRSRHRTVDGRGGGARGPGAGGR